MTRTIANALYVALAIAIIGSCSAQTICTDETCPVGITVKQVFPSADCSGTSSTNYRFLTTTDTCYTWYDDSNRPIESNVTVTCSSSGIVMNRFVGPSGQCLSSEHISTVTYGTETCFVGSQNTSFALWCSLSDAQTKTPKAAKAIDQSAPQSPKAQFRYNDTGVTLPADRCAIITYKSDDCAYVNLTNTDDPFSLAFGNDSIIDAAELNVCYGASLITARDSWDSNGVTSIQNGFYFTKNFKGGGCSSSSNLYMSVKMPMNKCIPYNWRSSNGEVHSNWAKIVCNPNSSTNLSLPLTVLLLSLLSLMFLM